MTRSILYTFAVSPQIYISLHNLNTKRVNFRVYRQRGFPFLCSIALLYAAMRIWEFPPEQTICGLIRGGVSIYTQMTALEKRSDVHDRQRRRNRLDALFTACLIAQAIFLEDRVNNHQLRNLCLYRAKLEGTLIGTAAQNNI